MAKQKKSEPGSVFVGIDDKDILFKRNTLSEAGSKAMELLELGINDQITLLEVRRAYYVYLPDPQIESEELNLADLLVDDENEE